MDCVLPNPLSLFHPCTHISVTISCVKIRPALVCSWNLLLVSPQGLNWNSSGGGTQTTHCSSEAGPAQFLLDPYSFKHLSRLVNIELFIQNKWCFEAELEDLYLQGSSCVISMFSCLGRRRFVSFCWVFESGPSLAVATRDQFLSRTKQNHEICWAGRDPQGSPSPTPGPSTRVAPWAQECCPNTPFIETLRKKLKIWKKGAEYCTRMEQSGAARLIWAGWAVCPSFPTLHSQRAPSSIHTCSHHTPEPPGLGGVFVFAQKKGEQLLSHTSAHSFSCL